MLSEHAGITLEKEGQVALARLLTEPSPPTAAMKELMDLPDLSMRNA